MTLSAIMNLCVKVDEHVSRSKRLQLPEASRMRENDTQAVAWENGTGILRTRMSNPCKMGVPDHLLRSDNVGGGPMSASTAAAESILPSLVQHSQKIAPASREESTGWRGFLFMVPSTFNACG